MAELDFTNGNMWGHSLHAHTFYEAKCGSWLSKLWDKYKNRRRYEVMVHSQTYPEIGGIIKYKTSNGIGVGKIYKFTQCNGVRDMFTIFFMRED